MPRLFRKKPITIEARHINAEDWDEVEDIAHWAEATIVDIDMFRSQGDNAVMVIPTLEGPMYADDGDWIIKGIHGEFNPIKPEIFEATYDALVQDRL